MPRIRAAVVEYDANAGMLIDHMMPKLLASCFDDKWPPELRACIAAQTPRALAFEHACDGLVSPELEQQVRARLTR
jgi:hypothetical protein